MPIPMGVVASRPDPSGGNDQGGFTMNFRIQPGMAIRLNAVCATLFLAVFASTAAADQVFSTEQKGLRPNRYPVTELRWVQEPGNFHYVKTGSNDFILTDFWWREVTIGTRDYRPGGWNPGAPGGPGVPSPQPPAQPDRFRKVYVEIVDGKGIEFFDKKAIKPVSFTLFEDYPREVEIRYGRTRRTIVASFDGYHVSLGLEQDARVVPQVNGRRQELGDGLGLDDVAIVVYWESDNQGGVRYYKEPMPKGRADDAPDPWGEQLKSKVKTP